MFTSYSFSYITHSKAERGAKVGKRNMQGYLFQKVNF